INSYHLSKIYDNNNQLLADFTYEDSTENFTDSTSLYYSIEPIQLQSQIEYWLNSGFLNYEIHGLLPKNSFTSKTKSIATKKIKQIDVINKAKIEFTLEQGREDSKLNSTAHKLKSITIKDWLNTNLKKFDFDFDYSNIKYSSQDNKRLMLKKVSEKNFVDNKTFDSKFIYKWQNISSLSLTPDYWGYYKHNGTGNETDPE